MSDQDERQELRLDTESDDVEILEVVGVDAGAAPPSPDMEREGAAGADEEVVLFGNHAATATAGAEERAEGSGERAGAAREIPVLFQGCGEDH